MTVDDVMKHLEQAVSDTLAMKGCPPTALTASTRVLGGDLAIDSLDLAAIVVTLAETTGKDPFSEGFIEFRTIGELAKLYSD
jgi:acyl carrier protein